jgi:general secretion pathway protein E
MIQLPDFLKFQRKPALSDAARAQSMGHRLARMLLDSEMISTDLLDRASELAENTGRSIAQTLLDMGVLSEEQLYAAYSDITGWPTWSGRGTIADDTPFPPEFLVYNRILPVAGPPLTYVVSDPEDGGLIDILQRLSPGAEIALFPESEIAFRLEDHFKLERRDGEDERGEMSDVEHLKDLALEAPIIRQVNDIIANGVKIGASDIHLEPFRNRVELRYRVDGVLHNRAAPAREDFPAIISRVKILAQLDIAERRLPQDGRIKLRTGGKDVDIRVSTIPLAAGEDVALRLLDQKRQVLELEQLGFGMGFIDNFRACLKHSHGLVLVTGPTGSGKTTCLYAGLKELVDGRTKIITVEDPVEFEIPGLSQIQVNSEIGLSFADTLRSILRHDPDVIFVGEIRDRETAEIAVQSALTGHLVLSTIHTNDAVGAVGRLLNMGVPDYLIASSLIAVTGQRLVRTLCQSCRRSSPVEPVVAERFGLAAGAPIYEAAGCDQCGDIGYRGRTPIAEILVIESRLRQLILTKPTADALQQCAREAGFRSMIDDGMEKVTGGSTTIDEVLRVAR